MQIQLQLIRRKSKKNVGDSFRARSLAGGSLEVGPRGILCHPVTMRRHTVGSARRDLRGTKYVPKLSRLLLIVGTANSNVSHKCTDCNPIDASLASKQGTNIPVK